MQLNPLWTCNAAQHWSQPGVPGEEGAREPEENGAQSFQGHLGQLHPQLNAFQGEPLADSCIISWPDSLCFREPGETCGSMPRVPAPFLPVCLAFAIQN